MNIVTEIQEVGNLLKNKTRAEDLVVGIFARGNLKIQGNVQETPIKPRKFF